MMPIKATKVKSVSTCDHCCNRRFFDVFRYFLLILAAVAPAFCSSNAAPFSTSRKAAPLLKSVLHLKIEIRDLSRHSKTSWVWCHRPFWRSPCILQVLALTGRLPRCTADDCLLYQGFVGHPEYWPASACEPLALTEEACHALLSSWGPPYEPWEMPRKKWQELDENSNITQKPALWLYKTKQRQISFRTSWLLTKALWRSPFASILPGQSPVREDSLVQKTCLKDQHKHSKLHGPWHTWTRFTGILFASFCSHQMPGRSSQWSPGLAATFHLPCPGCFSSRPDYGQCSIAAKSQTSGRFLFSMYLYAHLFLLWKNSVHAGPNFRGFSSGPIWSQCPVRLSASGLGQLLHHRGTGQWCNGADVVSNLVLHFLHLGSFEAKCIED